MATLNIKPHPFKAHIDQIELTEECKVCDIVPNESHFHVFKNGEKVGINEHIYSDDVIDIISFPQGGIDRNEAKNVGLQALTIFAVTALTQNFAAGLKAGGIIAGLGLAQAAISPNPSLKNRGF